MSNTGRLAFVICNWGPADDTIACIESILRSTVVPAVGVIVDNASPGRAGEMLRSHYQHDNRIEVVRLPRNIGFTGGVNEGIRRALSRGATWIWLLNNDTIVDRLACELLLKRAQSDRGTPKVVGCKILRGDDTREIWFAGGVDEGLLRRPVHRGIGEADRGQYDCPAKVDFITGCSMLFESDLFRKVGEFDETYFAYCEDYDWCKRAVAVGAECIYEPQATITHKVSGSTKQRWLQGGPHPLSIFFSTRNHIITARRYSPYPQLSVVVIIARAMAYAFRCALTARTRQMKASLLGAWHGVACDVRRRNKPDLTLVALAERL